MGVSVQRRGKEWEGIQEPLSSSAGTGKYTPMKTVPDVSNRLASFKTLQNSNHIHFKETSCNSYTA